jgi:hypothetical protein
MIGHQGESTVEDMTTYVRTPHATPSTSATINDATLKRRTAFPSPCGGENRKNAHPTIATTGTMTSKVASTVAL